MKILRRVGLIGALAILPLGIAAVPANAYPDACSTWVDGNNAYSVCYSGTGSYQAIAVCQQSVWQQMFGGRTYEYGPWVAIGQISQATCPYLLVDYAGINYSN